MFSRPDDITEPPSTWPTNWGYGPDTLYITDLGNNSVFAMDPTYGTVKQISPPNGQSNKLDGPSAIVIIGNYIYVSNFGSNNDKHFIVQIDLSNGNQQVTNSGGDGSDGSGFLVPTGMYKVPGTSEVYLVDEQQAVNHTFDNGTKGHFGKVWELDPSSTSVGTVIATGDPNGQGTYVPYLDTDEDPGMTETDDTQAPNTAEETGNVLDVVVLSNGDIVVNYTGDYLLRVAQR